MTAALSAVPPALASETRLCVRVVTDAQAMAYDDLVVRIAGRFAVSSAEADDLAQEGRLGLLDAARLWRGDGGASFRTFAYYRVLARILTATKRERRRGWRGPKDVPAPLVSSLDEEDVDGATHHDRVGVPATQEDTCVRDATVAATVDALPERVRRVVVLVLEGLSYDEIGQALGMPVGTARAAVFEAHKFLASKSLDRRIGKHRRAIVTSRVELASDDMTYTKTTDEHAADFAAEVLNRAGHGGIKASAHKLAGTHHVVIRDPAENDVARAYRVADIHVTEVSAGGWDWKAWRARVKPEENLDVAVEYFLKRDRRDLARQDGSAIVTAAQRAALERFMDSKPDVPNPSTEQVEVLEVARRLIGKP